MNNFAVPKVLPPESSDFVHGEEDDVSSIKDVVEKDREASDLPVDQAIEVALSSNQSVT